MMYPSMLGGFRSDDDEHAFPGDAVLAKAEKDANGKMVDAVDWRIRPPTRVSPRDASFIRKFYLRDEERAKEWREAHPKPGPARKAESNSFTRIHYRNMQ